EVVRLVLLQPVDGGEDHRSRGASKQESMFSQTAAGTDGVGLLDEHDFVHVGLVELRRTDGRAETGYHAAGRRTAEGYRTDAVNGDDMHRSGPLPQITGAAHQSPGGAGADEQHIELWELAGDLRRRRAEMRVPVARIRVLVK